MLEGIVTEENKGGIVVNVKGVRVFVPASQSGQPRGADLSAMTDQQTVHLRITEVNRARRRVVGSIRSRAADEARQAAQAGLGEHRGGQALHRHREVHDQLRRVRGHRRRGRHGPHLRAVLEPHQEPRRGRVKVGDTMDVYVISFDR